jgi:hypothetical protein
MSLNLPLDQMSTEEKLQAMEALWTDLTRNAEVYDSPAWHEQVLREREQASKSGEDTFIDWEIAKRQLRNE